MTKAEDIARRWIGSDKGQTPQREAKARGLARRLNVSWDDVMTAKQAIEQQVQQAPIGKPIVVH